MDFKEDIYRIIKYYKNDFFKEKETLYLGVYLVLIFLVGAFLKFSYSLAKNILVINLGDFSQSMQYLFLVGLFFILYGILLLFLFLGTRQKYQVYFAGILLISSFLLFKNSTLIGILWGMLTIILAPDFSSHYDSFTWKPIIIIFTMVMVFFSGTITIQEIYGVEDWVYSINYNNSEKINLNCYSYKEKIPFILGYNSICTVPKDSKMENYSGNISIKTVHGEFFNQTTNNKISFIMTKEMPESIHLNLINNNSVLNHSVPVTTIWNNPFTFHSLEEYRETRRTFFGQFVALIAIVFLTIPFGLKKILDYFNI